MKSLDKLINYLLANHAGKRSRLRGLVLTRLVTIYGISAVLLLVRLKRLGTPLERAAEVHRFLRTSGALATASSLSPVLRRLTGIKNPQILWSVSVGTSLWASSSVPGWLSSYLITESINDRLFLVDRVKEIIQNLEPSSLITSRQIVLSLLVPLLYKRSKEGRVSSGAARFLFGRRTLLQDFMLIYCIWCLLSAYKSIKRFLLEKTRSRTYYPQGQLPRQVDDWPMISGNLKPLMDKLGEIHEITLQNSYSLFEKLMNSGLMQNVIPSLRWAIWRQLCVKTMHHSPPVSRKYTVNTSLMKSITLMLGFFVLDGSNGSMNVGPVEIRYLIRSILNTYLRDVPINLQKLLTFTFSLLALNNAQQKDCL